MSVARTTRVAVLLAGLILFGFSAASAAAQSSSPSSTVLSLAANGVVDPFMATYIERGIREANRQGDAAVLITIDTPGGLDSSMRRINEAILGSGVPVLCYTAPSGARAASAGTFIMLACPVNAMAPGTNIGAAHPVGVSGAIESEKVTNDAAAYIRSLAERWGRNADWAERAVRDAISASATDALGQHVVDLVEPSNTALLDAAGACAGTTTRTPSTGLLATQESIPGTCGATVTPFKMTLAESLLHAFADPNIAFLLLNIGFIALIVWVIHPAFHVSLAVGVVSTLVALAILETLPFRLAGLLLMVVAAILFVLDVKAKAHGVLTAGGIGVLILAGLFLFNPSIPSARVSLWVVVAVALLAGLLTSLVTGAMLKVRRAPRIAGPDALIGITGVTLTPLDPTGFVRARGESWRAESRSGPVPVETTVRITAVRGLTVEVEFDPDTARGAAPAEALPTGNPTKGEGQ